MNVFDKYKNMSQDQIRDEVARNALPYAVCMMQIQHDFNFGTVVRNANAFGAREVFYYGPSKKWDRRGAVGAHSYFPVTHIRDSGGYSDISKINSLREKYPIFVALDIVEGVSTPLETHTWEPGTLLFLGEEGCGLPPEILGMCDHVLHISQRGSVRSINVGTASGIAMHLISGVLGKK